MKVQRLVIHNFRAFHGDDLELSSFKRFNLVVGNNASGKTSLLDALCTGLSPWLQGLNARLDIRNIEPHDIHCRYLPAGQEKTLEESPETAVLLELVMSDHTYTVTRYRRGRGGRTSHSPIPDLSRQSKAFSRFATAQGAAVKKGDLVVLPLLCYYGTGRLWLTPRKTSRRQIDPRSRLAGYRASMDPRTDPQDFKHWIK